MSGSPHHSHPGKLPYTPSPDKDKSTTVASSTLGKRRQACEHCRNSKAKCIFENDSDAICKNCAKSKRECIIENDKRYPTHPREGNEKRKRRNQNHSAIDWKSTPRSREQNEGSNLDPIENLRSSSTVIPSFVSGDNPPPGFSTNDTSVPTVSDVIDRGMLSANTAEKFFNFFLRCQVPRLPWIGFPTTPSFSLCRSQVPFLFLAIITAGAGCDSSSIQSQLVDEFYKTMAQEVIYRSRQKSPDVVHAILICTLWTPPPERLEELRYSTNIHLAASLVLDVTHSKLFDMTSHMGTGTTSMLLSRKALEESKKGRDNGSGKIEGWRILLACFACCSMMALTLKRPSVMRCNAKIEKALAKLTDSETSLPDIAMRDKTIIKWLQLHRIAEAFAEAKDSMPNDSDAAITKRLVGASFEARLVEWRKLLTQSDENSESLMIEYHFIHLETALLAMVEPKQETEYPFTSGQLTVCPADITIVSKSVVAAKSILDRFFNVDAKDIPALPSMLFQRMVVAIMTLVKATRTIRDWNDSSAKKQEGARGNCEEGLELLTISVKHGLGDIKSIQVVEYIEKGIDFLSRAEGPRPGRSDNIIKLLMLVKGWYFKNVLGQVESLTRISKGEFGAAARSQADTTTTIASDPKGTLLSPQTNFRPATSNSFASVTSTMGMSPSNTNYQGNIATAKSEDASRHYSLPPLVRSRLLPSFSSLQQSPAQVRSELPVATAMIGSQTSYADGGTYSVDSNNPVNSYPPFDPGSYAMGMDGIPPLNSSEENQFNFLDALLGPSNGGVPFGMMNDAMDGFGWM